MHALKKLCNINDPPQRYFSVLIGRNCGDGSSCHLTNPKSGNTYFFSLFPTTAKPIIILNMPSFIIRNPVRRLRAGAGSKRRFNGVEGGEQGGDGIILARAKSQRFLSSSRRLRSTSIASSASSEQPVAAATASSLSSVIGGTIAKEASSTSFLSSSSSLSVVSATPAAAVATFESSKKPPPSSSGAGASSSSSNNNTNSLLPPRPNSIRAAASLMGAKQQLKPTSTTSSSVADVGDRNGLDYQSQHNRRLCAVGESTKQAKKEALEKTKSNPASGQPKFNDWEEDQVDEDEPPQSPLFAPRRIRPQLNRGGQFSRGPNNAAAVVDLMSKAEMSYFEILDEFNDSARSVFSTAEGEADGEDCYQGNTGSYHGCLECLIRKLTSHLPFLVLLLAATKVEACKKESSCSCSCTVVVTSASLNRGSAPSAPASSNAIIPDDAELALPPPPPPLLQSQMSLCGQEQMQLPPPPPPVLHSQMSLCGNKEVEMPPQPPPLALHSQMSLCGKQEVEMPPPPPPPTGLHSSLTLCVKEMKMLDNLPPPPPTVGSLQPQISMGDKDLEIPMPPNVLLQPQMSLGVKDLEKPSPPPQVSSSDNEDVDVTDLDRMTSTDRLIHRYEQILCQDSNLSLLGDMEPSFNNNNKLSPMQSSAPPAVAPSPLAPAPSSRPLTSIRGGGGVSFSSSSSDAVTSDPNFKSKKARPLLTRGGAVTSVQETYFGRSTRNLLGDYGDMLDTYDDILEGECAENRRAFVLI
jgi:hypothetical protein